MRLSFARTLTTGKHNPGSITTGLHAAAPRVGRGILLYLANSNYCCGVAAICLNTKEMLEDGCCHKSSEGRKVLPEKGELPSKPSSKHKVPWRKKVVNLNFLQARTERASSAKNQMFCEKTIRKDAADRKVGRAGINVKVSVERRSNEIEWKHQLWKYLPCERYGVLEDKMPKFGNSTQSKAAQVSWCEANCKKTKGQAIYWWMTSRVSKC